WSGACTDQPDLASRDIVSQGLPAYRDVLQCVRAVGRAMDYGDFLARQRQGAAPVRPAGADTARARALLGSGPLTEHRSKAVLAAYGFDVTREQVAASAAEAQA